MLQVPPSFRAMPRWWHDEPGRAWLDALPSLVEDQCRRWRLERDGVVRHGSNALVLPVRRGQEALALRMAPPDDDVAREAATLRFWGGRGTVLLHDADTGRRALLLERLDASRSLQGVDVREAAEVFGALTKRLAVPAPADAPSTRSVAVALADSLERDWDALARPLPRPLLDRALTHVRDLADAECSEEAVDGDLHHQQVLAGDRDPWLVVDPELLSGDREHDLGRVLWSRLDEVPDDGDVLSLVAAFVRAADVPRERARSWVVARSAAYLLWGLAHGLTQDPPRCRRLLELLA